jgi:hypothetical protein
MNTLHEHLGTNPLSLNLNEFMAMRRRAIVAELQAGKTVKELAKELGLSPARISQIATKEGYSIRAAGRKPIEAVLVRGTAYRPQTSGFDNVVHEQMEAGVVAVIDKNTKQCLAMVFSSFGTVTIYAGEEARAQYAAWIAHPNGRPDTR